MLKKTQILFRSQTKKASTSFIKVLNFLLKPLKPSPLKFYIRNTLTKLIEYLEFKTQIFLNIAPKEVHFENIEGLSEFNFSIPCLVDKKGISAFIRVKNEADKIHYCLISIIDLFDEIIIVDNQSTDGTIDIIHAFKKKYDSRDIIKIFSYPFIMSRFGSEYNKTPENSVHNFAYFSNYVISKCSYKYICKWDADMVFKRERKSDFINFVERINKANKISVWNLYGQTLYRDMNKTFWLSHKEINYEPRIFSLTYFNTYAKGKYFEILNAPSLNLNVDIFWWKSNSKRPLFMRKSFSEITFYELKFFSGNEFSHWTDTNVAHTTRKKKELETFNLIKTGEISKDHAFSQFSKSSMLFTSSIED